MAQQEQAAEGTRRARVDKYSTSESRRRSKNCFGGSAEGVGVSVVAVTVNILITVAVSVAIAAAAAAAVSSAASYIL
jgi:hypothetical protein